MAPKSQLNQKDQDAVDRVLRDFDKAEESHKTFSNAVDRKYDSYRGLLRETSEAAEWTSRLHPRYIHQVIETITSALIDPTFKFQIAPRPKNLMPSELENLATGAKVLERLLAWELDVDDFGVKQRPFVLQGNIAGLTVGKNYWYEKKADQKKLVMGTKTAVDDYGNYLGTYPALEEVSTEGYLRDGPCFEVVDVRDFFWQEGAVSPETSAYFIHRLWKTKEELQFLQSIGVYGKEAGGQSLDDLSDIVDSSTELSQREQKYSTELRTKDRISVLEYWTDREVITVAGRDLLLSRKQNPFWHGQKPFVIASPLPDLFRIPGMSVVELIEDLQEMLWTLINQRLDATRLLANPAYAVRSDLDDFGQLEEIGPGSLIVLEDVNQIKPFEINPNIPRMTLEAEGMIKADLQNISGGAPFMSGMGAAPNDQTTATGVTIVANLATKAMQARKVNFVQAYEKMGTQWVAMLQQFIREPRAFRVVGQDAQHMIKSVSPTDIQGQFDVSIKVSNESTIKQERLAEAQAKLQVAVQSAPVFQATGNPLNLKAFMNDYLEAYDIDDPEQYYTQLPQAQAPGQPGQGPPQPGQPGTGGPPGVTNAEAAAGPQAPSNQTSLSPMAQMQQHMASRGGGPVNR